jgi:hypothetical protein
MRLFPALSCMIVFCGSLAAQSVCPDAPVLSRSRRANIFSEQQEMDLGEVVAESLAYTIRVIEDDALVRPLRRIGNRVAQQMPASKLEFRFFLIDDPNANAWALPGGRIYVTRKLVSITRNEDELAGVLAHEMGHSTGCATEVAVATGSNKGHGSTGVMGAESDWSDDCLAWGRICPGEGQIAPARRVVLSQEREVWRPSEGHKCHRFYFSSIHKLAVYNPQQFTSISENR